MSMREFNVVSGMDFSIHLRIDMTIMTPEYASDIVQFWVGGDQDLADAGGDPYEPLARRAAARLWAYLLDGYHEAGAVATLHEQEGWCIPAKSIGITIIDYDIPLLDPEDLDVTEIKREGAES